MAHFALKTIPPASLVVILGMLGLVLSTVAEVADTDASDWDALREIGGALVVSAAVGAVLYLMEKRREDARDAHDRQIAQEQGERDERLAVEQKRHLLVATIATQRSIDGLVLDAQDLKGIVLAGRDLSGTSFKDADLSGADLTGANLNRANLEGANLTRANLEGANLTNANLERATLREADLSRAELAHVSAHGADFTGATLIGTRLIDFWAIEAKFDNAYAFDFLAVWVFLRNSSFKDATLGKYGTFAKADLEGVVFSGATLSHIDFLGGLPQTMISLGTPGRWAHSLATESGCNFDLIEWQKASINGINLSESTGIYAIRPGDLSDVSWNPLKPPKWPTTWSEDEISGVKNHFDGIEQVQERHRP